MKRTRRLVPQAEDLIAVVAQLGTKSRVTV